MNAGTSARGWVAVVETMAVACAAGVLVMLAFSSVGEMASRRRVDGAAADLARSPRIARATALRERRDVALPFDVARNHYVPDEISVVALPAGVEFAAPQASATGAAVSFVPPGRDTGAVRFTARGVVLGSTAAQYGAPAGAAPAGWESGAPAGAAPAGWEYAYLGDRVVGVYARVAVSATGAVRTERWNGSAWR